MRSKSQHGKLTGMTPGDTFLLTISLKSEFRDAHERRAYRRAMEIAKRIVDKPALVLQGRTYLERFIREDPHQRRVYETWDKLVDEEPQAIGRQLLADDAIGAFLRETAPVFTEIGADQARVLWVSERAIAPKRLPPRRARFPG